MRLNAAKRKTIAAELETRAKAAIAKRQNPEIVGVGELFGVDNGVALSVQYRLDGETWTHTEEVHGDEIKDILEAVSA